MSWRKNCCATDTAYMEPVLATASGRNATLALRGRTAYVRAQRTALHAQLAECEAQIAELECTRKALGRQHVTIQERLDILASGQRIRERQRIRRDVREQHNLSAPPSALLNRIRARQQNPGQRGEAVPEAKAGEDGAIINHGVEFVFESDAEDGTEGEEEEWRVCTRVGPIQYQCAGCGKTGTKGNFQMCSGCRVTRYCQRDCQLRHFRTGHRQVCARVGGPRTRRRTARMEQRQARLEEDEAMWEVRVESHEWLLRMEGRMGWNVSMPID